LMMAAPPMSVSASVPINSAETRGTAFRIQTPSRCSGILHDQAEMSKSDPIQQNSGSKNAQREPRCQAQNQQDHDSHRQSGSQFRNETLCFHDFLLFMLPRSS
jgi:hypothetical protein